MIRTETFQCPACYGDLVADIEEVATHHAGDCHGCAVGLAHNVHRVQLQPHDCGLVTITWVDEPGTIESAAAAAAERFWARPLESKILD